MRLSGLACLVGLAASSAAATPLETDVSFRASDIGRSFTFDKAYEKGPQLTLTGRFARPEGQGPFPAIVQLHTCAGSVPDLDGAWVGRFVRWGFAVLRIDSFGPRGIRSVCDGRVDVPAFNRAGDAYAAKTWLSRRSDVDPDRIILAGWSHGGTAVLTALGSSPSDFGADGSKPFLAGIAFYPDCVAPNRVQAPMLILIGEADTWTPAYRCRAMPKDEKIRIEYYPDATHGFDIPRANLVMEGHRIRHDPKAEALAVEAVHAFLFQMMP
jgi:dienelactone hydrolase